MLTLFTMPKPFRGQIAVIQRNAIESWLQLRPACEIILLGDDEGTAEAAREFGLCHLPEVADNEYGTPLLDSIFERAQAAASHRLLCYVNADIILMSDFLPAISRIRWSRFLMLGQRRDLDVTRLLDFDDPAWETKLRAEAHRHGCLHPHTGVDYYVFPKGLWGEIPPFAVGRTSYDNWLIWRTRSLGVPAIDATRLVTCIHQNHDRTYTSLGIQPPEVTDDLTTGVEAKRNRELAGGWEHISTLRDANWLLTPRWCIPAWTKEHRHHFAERLERRGFDAHRRGQPRQAATYLVKAVLYRPSLLSHRSVISILIESIVGTRLMSRLRSWRRKAISCRKTER